MPPDEPDGRPLFRLLASAIALWIGSTILFVAWFFATTPDPGLAAFGIPLVVLAIGYVGGGLGLVLVGAVKVVRRRVPRAVALWAGVVYFLPPVLVGLVLQIPILLTPLTSAEGDLGGLVAAAIGPLLVVLYLAGLASGYAVRHRPLRRTVTAILVPPIVGLVLATGWSVWSVVGSPEGRARGSMAFTIERVDVRPERVTAEGMLTLERAGAYLFHATYLETRGGTSGGRATTINWPDGVPARPGRYRCQLIFDQVVTDPDADSRLIIVEVRADTGGVYEPPVAEFRIPVDALLVPAA